MTHLSNEFVELGVFPFGETSPVTPEVASSSLVHPAPTKSRHKTHHIQVGFLLEFTFIFGIKSVTLYASMPIEFVEQICRK